MFYPLIKLDNFEGTTTIHNFAPNNWESIKTADKFIYLNSAIFVLVDPFLHCCKNKKKRLQICNRF